MSTPFEERLIERLVSYSVEVDGRIVVVENVPARVNGETGARRFSALSARSGYREWRKPVDVMG